MGSPVLSQIVVRVALRPLLLMEEETGIHPLFHHPMVGPIKQLVLPLLLLLLPLLQVVMEEIM